MTLDPGLEVRDFIGRRGMLQVIERAAVGDSRDQRAELERSHRDAFAERAHFADAAEFRRDLFFGISPDVFGGDVIAGQFAESVLMRVVADLVEAEFASDGFEVRIVRVRESCGEIHAAATAERDFRVLVDQAFAEPGQSDGELDGGAGLRAAGKREFLIHHGEDASARRLDRDHRAVHVAQRVDRSLPYGWVFARGDVAFRNLGCEGTGVEALVITMAAMRGGIRRARGAAAGKSPHVFPGVLIFGDRARLGTGGECARVDAGGDRARFQQQCQP